MAFLFPSGPTVGQRFTPVGGPTYIWTGSTWDATGAAIDLTPYQVNGPTFSAYQSGTAQVLTASVWNKIVINTEEFDTNNNFDSTTNYRFTPTVAGYYQVSGAVQFAGAATIGTSMYKNGSGYKTFGYIVGALGQAVGGSAIVYMNGSSDYVELYAISNVTATIQTGLASTWFQASLIRGA